MAAVLLAIYIALIFIRPMEWWPPVENMRLVDIAAIATLVSLIPRLLKQYYAVWRIPQVKFALGLLVAVALSWLYPFSADNMINSFVEMGKTIVLFLAIILLARSPVSFRGLLWTIFACVGWMAVHGILQAHFGTGFGGEAAMRRERAEGDYVYQIIAFGIFHDPNDLCLVFVCTMPLLYAVHRTATSVLGRTLSLAMIPFMLYGAWLTNSRGGIVGICGMLAAYVISRLKGYRRWAVIGVGVCLVVFIAPSRFNRAEGVDMGRVWAWGNGIDAFKSHPIFGIGFGNFRSISEIVAHNSYIHALAELGLVGYVPWFMLIALTMVQLRRLVNLKDAVDKRHQYIVAGFFSALVGYLTSAYFLSRCYDIVLFILLALAISEIAFLCRDPEMRDRVFGSLRKDMKLSLICCLASIPMFWVAIRIAGLV